MKVLLNKQRAFYYTGITKDYRYRKKSLTKLYNAIKVNEDLILEALKKDLNKSYDEAYMTEVGFTLSEITFIKKHLKKWMKLKKVKTPLTQAVAKSFIYPEPYGVVLILAPWNYPMQLALAPLAGAIAAGNCAIIKPSELAPYTSSVIAKIIKENFSEEYIAVIEGGVEVSSALLEGQFDYIFFTGSVNVGKIVMSKASKYLTPVTLELGGKSPCIVDNSADIVLAAKRIIWGKFINAGQTCVAPDYVLVDKSVKEKLISAMVKYINTLYGESEKENYPKIISKKHYDRLLKLIEGEKVIVGGYGNDDSLQIAPTLLDDVSLTSNIMQEEIFGPILPIITVNNLDEAINIANSYPKPLALYLFTNSKVNKDKVLKMVAFGGGCINDTIVHLASTFLPFGGVGSSGMGSYHGKASFDTFTHYKSIMKRANIVDINLRYPPYGKKITILRKFQK